MVQVMPFSLWVERMNWRCSGLASWQAMQRLRDFLRLHTFEGEDLGLIAASLDMRRAGSMARFAAMNLFAPNLGAGSFGNGGWLQCS